MKWTHSYTSEQWRCRWQKHVCSPQARTNITIAEAEAADASAKQWLRRQNLGRAGGEPCKKTNYFFKLRKPSPNKCVFLWNEIKNFDACITTSVCRTLQASFFLGSACANDKCVEACDEGWEKLGDHCYRWSTNVMNWTAAEDFCQEEGGHLASVGSNETMDNIMLGFRRGGFGDNDYFWLGGNDLAKEGVWEWTDCTPWEFSLWLPEEPSNWNGIEHCVAFRVNNRWNAVRLSAGARPLCSKKICSDKGIV